MKLRNRVVSAGLAALLAGPPCLVSPAVPAAADPAPTLESVAARLDELGAQLAEAQGSLAEAVTRLEETDYGIAQKSAQVEEARADLAERQGELGRYLRDSYKSGAASLLDFVLGSASGIEADIRDLEGRQSEQRALVDELRGQVSDYEGRVAEARELYDSLDEQARAQVVEAGGENVAAAVQAVETDRAQQAASSGPADAAGATEGPAEDAGAGEAAGGGQQAAPDADPAPQPDPEPEPEPTPDPEPSAPAGGGVSTALAQVGKPYAYGSAGPDAFDCSGLVCYSYGYALGRDTYSMISALQGAGRWKTSMDELSYGDLVFPSTGHVGIYIGSGMMVHASSPGVGVVTAPVYAFVGGGSYY